MPLFSYEATDPSGQTVTGVIESESKAGVIEKLQREKYFPVAITTAKKKKEFSFDFKFKKEVMPQKELVNFTRQMTTLLRSGLEIDRCLEILLDLTGKEKSREVVRSIKEHIQQGETLSSAMDRQKGAFTPLYISMVKAGETGGFLEKSFDRLAWFLENRMKMVDSIRSALIYPGVIFLTGVAALIVLTTNVIPRFASIFDKMGGELPASTSFLIGASRFFIDNWLLVILGIIFSVAAFVSYLRTDDGRRQWEKVLLKLPLIGDLVRKSVVSQFTRTLGTLLQSGVPIIQSLTIVKETISNKILADTMSKTIQAVKEGKRISSQMKESGIFPQLAIHMTLAGEETGTLDEMMIRMAHIYDDEVETAVKRLLTVFEPAMILVMGVVVAFVVVSMLSAIVSVNDLPF
jgi:general secretion pathway protein F